MILASRGWARYRSTGETQPRSRAADIAPQPAVAAPITINLELTRIGHRNISLFNVVRTWAYVQPKPRTVEAWAATVLKCGREQNRRFPAWRISCAAMLDHREKHAPVRAGFGFAKLSASSSASASSSEMSTGQP